MTNYTLRNIHVFSKNGVNFVFDGDSMNIYEITKETMENIISFQNNKLDKLDNEIINELIKHNLILDNDEYQKELNDNLKMLSVDSHQEGYFNKIVLGISNLCNMNCKYCYGSGGSYGRNCELMNVDIAKKSIDYLIQKSGHYQTLSICFFGGEPLCNFSIMEYVIQYCKEISEKTNKNFKFSITTNGTLINDKIISFLKRNSIAVLLSLDGPKHIHDLYRKLNDGSSTYDIVKSNMLKLKANGIHVSTRATICANYIKIKNIHKHAFDLGAINSYASLVSVDEDSDLFITSKQRGKIIKEYEKMAEEFYDNIMHNNFNFNSPIKPFLSKLYYKARKVIPCGAGTRIRAINYQGKVFPCQRFMDDDKFIIDNVLNNISISSAIDFKKYNVLSSDICGKCWMKYLCSGGCLHSNIKKGGDMYACSNELCDLLNGIYEICIYTYWKIKQMSPDFLDKIFENN